MPVNDIIGMVMSLVQIGLQVGEMGIVHWILFNNGWVYLGRVIGFRIDLRIVHYIGVFYDYFMKMLSNDIFNEDITREILTNIYVFIGVIMAFRLMMLLMKYLINPDLTADAKLGVTSLIRRVIIGCVGILFIPTIFDLALKLQSGIIQDNLIQKIIIPKSILPSINKVQAKGGKYIATFIQAGFVTPSDTAPQSLKDSYKTGIENGDLSVLKGSMLQGFLGDVDNYDLNYVPIVSTIVLAYALMQMAKYCLDLAVRCLRLLLYKILTPVAMIEYMIKGADDGVFKAWKKAIISTYVSLFVRVMALWFVIFVTALMQTNSGIDSKYIAGSLLEDPNDTLLRALIIVALLGFMMDLPKLVGSLFDLDLEQSGGADGVFKSITGLVKSGYIAGIGATAAMVGSGVNALGAGKDLLKQVPGIKNGLNKTVGSGFFNNNRFGQGLKGFADASGKAGTADRLRAGNMGLLGAAAAMNPITKGILSGYQSTEEAGRKEGISAAKGTKGKEKEAAQRAEDQAEARENADRVARQVESNAQKQVQTLANQIAQNNPSMSEADIKQKVEAQLGVNADAVTAALTALQGQLAGGLELPIKAVAKQLDDATGGGHINSITASIESVVGQGGAITAGNVSGVVAQAQTDLEHTISVQAASAAHEARVAFPQDASGTPQHGYVNGAPVVVQDTSSTTTSAPGPTITTTGSGPTIDLDSVKINVTGKAEANYNGGLETTITGPAKTTYNGSLETEFNGDVKGYYNQGMTVDVGGPVSATYYDNIDVKVGGSVNTDVQQDVNTTIHQDVNNVVEGSVTNTVKQDVDNLVEGNVTNVVEQNVENLVKNQSTIVQEDSVTQINGKATTVVNKDADIHVNGNVNTDIGNNSRKNKDKDDA